MGEHKQSAQKALSKMLNAIAAAERQEQSLAPTDDSVGTTMVDSDDDSHNLSGSYNLHRQRAVRYHGWYKAIRAMAAANNPTALLDLDLSTRFVTGEPMFLQVLDEEAKQLRDEPTGKPMPDMEDRVEAAT